MKMNYIQRTLSQQFGKLGVSIARHPKTYILSSLFFSLLCATGLQNLKGFSDVEDLTEMTNGIHFANKRRLESLFPTNFSSFDPSRAITGGHFAIAIVVAKGGDSILNRYLTEHILLVDKLIDEIFIEWDDRKWKYRDLCSKKQGNCYKNKILSLLNESQYENGNNVILEYPLKINESTQLVEYDTLALGGTTLGKDNNVLSAKAVKLMYFLDDSSKTRQERAKLWEKLFLELKFEKFEHVSVEKFSTISMNEEISTSVKKSLPYAPTMFSIMFIFAIVSCCSTDCVRSKPWIGLLTGVSSVLSLISGFGILQYFGLRMVPMNCIAPFIILGIGMDDTFVMLAAWFQTDPKKPVEERLAEAFTDVGISITITSLTNFAAFLIGGVIGSLSTTSTFCIYMAACVAFNFIYQLTFIGGLMAVFGYAENRGLNSFTFRPLKKPCKKDCYQGCLKRIVGESFCKFIKEKPFNIRGINFWSFFAELLTTSVVKSFTIIGYLAYLGWCAWSATTLQERMEIKNFAFYDSYIQRYFDVDDRYFYQYSQRLQIVIDKPLDYSKPLVQASMEKLLHVLEEDELIGGSLLTESWLKSYLKYISNDRIAFLFSNYNFTSSKEFFHVLKRFLRLPLAKRFESDIVFDSNSTQLKASRFFLQTNITRDFSDFHKKLTSFIQKAQKESPYPIIIYHPSLTFIEMIENTMYSTLITLSVVVFIAILICSLLLSSVTCSICVAFSVFSVFLGIAGFMEPWDMHMNVISAAALLVIAGLSVDYAAHISYAYCKLDEGSVNDRVRYAVATYGGPVVQGCISTLIGVSAFIRPPSHNHESFAKIVFLACTISVIHAVIIIPVVLSLFQSIVNHIWETWCLYNVRGKPKLDDTRRLSRSTVSVNSIANHTFAIVGPYCIDDIDNFNFNADKQNVA